MIELIYDKNAEESQEKTQESKISSQEEFSLPKNIRQVGLPSENKKIYIEDYVITYLNYISKPGSTEARGAILLGEKKKTKIGEILFISGAVDAQNIELDMNETEFTQEIWDEIYNEIRENFPDLSIMGWFLARMGFSTAINEKIEKIHTENFPGMDKILYVNDSLDGEDAIYLYENGQLRKQKGYYIYYSKNELMQNYIIKKRGGTAEEENNEIKRKDSQLLKDYREKIKETGSNKQQGSNGLAYLASSFVVLAMLAMGITVMSNYDKMHDMEISLNRLQITASGNKTTQEEMTGDATENKELDVFSNASEYNESNPEVNSSAEDLNNLEGNNASEGIYTADDENSLTYETGSDGVEGQTDAEGLGEPDAQTDVTGIDEATDLSDDALNDTTDSNETDIFKVNDTYDNDIQGLTDNNSDGEDQSESNVEDNATISSNNSESGEALDDGIEENAVAETANESDNSETNLATEDNLSPVSTLSGKTLEKYIVEYGDTLSAIAEEKYGDIGYAGEIAKQNNMDVNGKIYEGQTLYLPEK